jgi:formylglycine-generating enzyme required for sulfatase activity
MQEWTIVATALVAWGAAACWVSAGHAQAPGARLRDCADCPELVVIPAGSFTMGTPDTEAGRDRGEGPRHAATIAAFAMGRSHVTRGEFAAFVRATGYRMDDGCADFQALRNPPWAVNPERSWRTPGFAQTDRHPVVCVSWDDAQAYVQWLSARTAHVYRLPSEAEWEYAARAGSTTARFWGEAPAAACAYANVADLTAAQAFDLTRTPEDLHMCRDGTVHTAPVAHFRPNRFGLADMLGNAWQWMADCYHDDYADAPTDGSAWATGECPGRVLRGGSWDSPPWQVRAGMRTWERTPHRAYQTGFRVARTLDQALR